MISNIGLYAYHTLIQNYVGSETGTQLESRTSCVAVSNPVPVSSPTPGPAGSGRRRPSPAGYCLTPTGELAKTERGPISTSGPSLSMSPNQATPAEKSIRFSLLAAAQPLNILSRPEALNASASRRACRVAISRNASSLPDFPEFARAVGYGVPETLPGTLHRWLDSRSALPDDVRHG